MENYKYEFSAKLQEWSDRPVHDRYSHMMDALRYVVQATKEVDFFNDEFFDTGKTVQVTSYTDDWSGVWGR